MHILLTAATTFEIQPTIDALSQEVGRGDWLTTLITGVGGIATTWSLMRQIGSKRPDLIIQAGIAGCLTEIKPGAVFAIAEDQLANLGVWQNESFHSLFDLGLARSDDFPFLHGRLVNPYRRLLTFTDLIAVNAITVNEITTDPLRINWYQQNTNAVVESMEGGSLHYVCLRESIPFIQMRSISNAVGVRDKKKWDIRLAIDSLNEQVIRIVRNLESKDRSIFEQSNH